MSKNIAACHDICIIFRHFPGVHLNDAGHTKLYISTPGVLLGVFNKGI